MEHFSETSGGLLFSATGHNLVLKWDGLAAQMETVGIIAPTVAPTVSGSGTGAIVGTYTAYLRFLDGDGNYSNLSPVSTAYDAQGTTGAIIGASNATPITITSTAHGLVTGNTVKIEAVGGNDGANNTWVITVTGADTFTLDESSGTDTYTGGGTWTSGVGTITYTAVQAPTEAKVTRRQILRNTDGQTTTYYVDVDTTDIASASFSSTKSDATLSTQESQSILDSDGNVLANRHGIPPSHKQVLASHLDRMFLAVQEDYARGSVKATFGSATVTGVGTDWTSQMAGRFLYIIGATASYEISTVDVPNQTLTLTGNYQGATDKFAVYAIRPAPAERRLVYFSGAGEPESWLATDALSVPEDDDEITGLMVYRSFLYVLERRHVHKITFEEDPKKDGGIFPGANRGCINQRCWVTVDDAAYMLDELGVHRFAAGEAEPLSDGIQEIFRPASASPWRINWRAAKWFHACLYRPQSVIRWFVTMEGMGRPRHCLAYNYRMQRWWIEEYPVPIGASAAGRIKATPHVFLGGLHRKVFSLWTGVTDMCDRSGGTIRGTATGATTWSLTDSTATFGTSVVNAPLAIVEGTGKGQVRRIVAQTATVLTVKDPWLVTPSTDSVYQIGGVQWNWRSQWMRFSDNETYRDRRFEILFEPTDEAAKMMVRYRHDFSPTAQAQGVNRTTEEGNKVGANVGETDLVVDLAGDPRNGLAQTIIGGHRGQLTDSPRFVQIEAEGATNQDAQVIYGVTVEGVKT